ncbi:hypothetical protein Y032_0094g2722 [Ancylostoma ceylanicum]|uniref:Uncharacterized protein n=1 Tax=Ancylostoma ceylanicum TaxID=53326 RepID=A0A016TLB6_9BILA|nr:hypothetical protein Y032_0094g2722 [Ancylostoma ceylanicum]
MVPIAFEQFACARTQLCVQSFRNDGADEVIGRSRGGTVDFAVHTNLILNCSTAPSFRLCVKEARRGR